jgi:hypothetical protein
MSFGSETGRTRSGSKGFSSKEKKQRRKKQEYHVHKRAHFQETERPDPEEVRKRTIIVLDRLGHQVLSSEPGGYDLDHWTRNVNSLLDDFQEKMGTELVGEEFRERRQKALSLVAAPSSARDVDSEIEKVIQEEVDARAGVEEAERKAAARLASMKEERDECAREVKAQRERLAALREAKQSRQFFSRILRSGPSTEEAEASVAALESKLAKLEEEIERSRKARSAEVGGPSGEGDRELLEARRRLEEARSKLLELQSSRQTLLQLAGEREAAAKVLSEMISSLKLDGAGAQVQSP